MIAKTLTLVRPQFDNSTIETLPVDAIVSILHGCDSKPRRRWHPSSGPEALSFVSNLTATSPWLAISPPVAGDRRTELDTKRRKTQ
jgi:hypothetical protein